LPRDFNDTRIIQLCFRRRHFFTKYIALDQVSPSLVLSALDYLMKKPLFIENNITTQSSWFSEHDSATGNINFHVDPNINEIVVRKYLITHLNALNFNFNVVILG
jgi:hypothetical protein